VAQVVEYPPSKCEALSIARKKKKSQLHYYGGWGRMNVLYTELDLTLTELN
jgi:hypothetical protein